MNLEEQYHAEGMLRKIERVEAERDNAWTELREIREAISANPEESTLDEVVKLRQQLAERVTELEQQGPRRGVQGIGRGMTYDEWLAQQENACDAVMYGRKVWEGAWSEIEQQLAAKDDEIRDLVTSDNKVIVDLSKYVETLEQKIVMLRETLQQKKAVDMLFATEAGTE